MGMLKKVPMWVWIAAVVVIALAFIGALGDKGKTVTATPTVTTATAISTTPKASPTPKGTTPAWEARLAAFEAENGLASSDWYKHVTSREIKYGNSLWVYTDMGTNTAAKSIAGSICGAYAQYALVDSAVGTTFVRAADGSQIAKCGPKA